MTQKTAPIEIVYQGESVTGVAFYSKNDLTVEITAPYRRYRNGAHIPAQALMKVSFDAPEYRAKRAEELLKACFDAVEYLTQNRDKAKSLVRQMDSEIAEAGKVYLDEENLKERRKELRKHLKSGDLEKNEYDDALQELTKSHRKFEELKFAAKRKVVESLQGTPLTSMEAPDRLREFVEDPASFGGEND